MIHLKFKSANKKQRKFIFSNKKYLLLSGAVGAGKSFLGCWKGFKYNLEHPGARGLICRKEARSLQNSTIKTLIEKVIPKEVIVSYNSMKGELVHETGILGVTSSIVFCGLDKKADQSYPTKIASTEYSWIFLDEGIEAEEGDWNMLMTRLRYNIPTYSTEENKKIPRQMFTATNPDAPTHFLYKFFFEADKADREYILTTPYDNPYLSKDYLKSLENSLSGIAKQRLLLGKWVQAEGIIYASFNREKHIGDTFLDLKDYKTIYFGADSNFPLPRAAVIAGLKEDGKLDILDEFYQENAHVEDLIEWLVEWQKKREWTIYGFHDPSDPRAIDKIGNTQGIICEKANNKVVPGINEVSRYFDNNLIQISSKCVNLIKEIQSYRWKTGHKGDAPEKKNDHLLDALRYMIASIEPLPEMKVYGAKIFN